MAPQDDLTADTFDCVACAQTFQKDWTDDEALAESVEVFGEIPVKDRCVVCDNCYKALRGEISP